MHPTADNFFNFFETMLNGKIFKNPRRKIVAINRDNNRIKKQKISAHWLEIYSLKQITINPVKNLKVETGIHVVLPNNPFGILMPVLDIKMLKHKSQKTII